MTDTIFNHETLQVGDMFYSVKERNQFFHRNKIHKEIDGVDWFRYDRPLRTYKLTTHEVLGIIRKELDGEWLPGEMCELETIYNVRSSTEAHTRTEEFYFSGSGAYFVDKQKALEYMKMLEDQAKEMDMPWPNHQ